MKRASIVILAVQMMFASIGFAREAYGPQLPGAQSQDDDDDVADSVQAIIYLDKGFSLGTLGSPVKTAPVEGERAESSPSSPPLAIDDPGTPGKHGYEINFITDCDLATSGHGCETGLDIAIGIGDKVQFRVSKFVTNDQAAGERSHTGLGSTDAGVKWRFYDKGGWQVATFPSFNIDDATRVRSSDGTLTESEGRSAYLPLLVSREIGQKLTILANVGYRQNLDRPENSSLFTAVAVGRSINDRSRAMVEIASEKARSSMRRTDVRVGYVRLISKKNRRYQFSMNTSIGHSIGPTEDGKGHTTLLFGITLAKQPRP